MALLTGLTADGTEVPVQVKPDGALVAEGLEGPAGPAGPEGPAGPAGSDATNYWSKKGSDLYYLDGTNGRVGIGTTSPGSALQVNGAGGVRVNEDGAGTKLIQIRSDYAGQGPAINVFTNHPLLFQTNDTERCRIDTSGRLLVGTINAPQSSPVGSIACTGGLYLRSPNGTWWQLTVDDSGALATTAAPVAKAIDPDRTGNLAP